MACGASQPELTTGAALADGKDGPAVGLRWTVGDVSARGFEALRLSILGARGVFGPSAEYAVCVNTLPLAEAKARLREAARMVAWHISDGHIPAFLADRLSDTLAEGVAWKFAPLRLFPDRFEIALDNDCVLWGMPAAVADWLHQDGRDAPRCLLAADMAPCFGAFAGLCGEEPRNTGIRGLPPGFDLAGALCGILDRVPDLRLHGEVDEQGLQVAALSAISAPVIVPTSDVTICSPFAPHEERLGLCGAHFVGLNMRRPRPEHGCDEAMLTEIAANWDQFRPGIERNVLASSSP